MCFRYRKLLIPYFEGDLSTGDARKVERHLAKCPRCRTELDAIRLVAGALTGSDTPPAEPANDLWARVSARIADEPHRRQQRDWFSPARGLAAGVAAAVIVGVLGVRLLMPTATHIARVDSPESSPKKQAALPVDNLADKQPMTKIRTTAQIKPAAAKPTPQAPSKREKPAPRLAPRGRRWFANKPVAPAKKPVQVAMNCGVSSETAKATESALVRSADGTSNMWPTEFTRGGHLNKSAEIVAPGDGATRSVGSPASPIASSFGETHSASGHHVLMGCRVEGSVNVYAAPGAIDKTPAAPTPSVVDDLNEAEGVRTAAIFSYP